MSCARPCLGCGTLCLRVHHHHHDRQAGNQPCKSNLPTRTQQQCSAAGSSVKNSNQPVCQSARPASQPASQPASGSFPSRFSPSLLFTLANRTLTHSRYMYTYLYTYTHILEYTRARSRAAHVAAATGFGFGSDTGASAGGSGVFVLEYVWTCMYT
ncbi:uncharacterized protein K452DRAFT_107284 [Aplosporella prunicola CBS 121167]|uniref:Uncharacterized protein n=1 Tax=Aplosporella prunicola CBS 121167 TaxID=1176127 RepID=A0A6A6BSD5_9PEZI|nr:uncharacterized protein K452DRAFT_107284 [Aplosporella prunicola CBS 121167]KAF2146195.1 hypothetical protein K452DRAFT_107284 [Aplosporella prunicola CBS 121167]